MMNRVLRLVRVYHDLSQSDAAVLVGLSKSYVSEMENGRKKITLDVLEKYSKAFDIPVSSLMLFSEESELKNVPEGARRFVTDKSLKMLEWIDTISSAKKESSDA